MAEETTNNGQQENEKLFTQADLDNLISRRLSEERKKYPTEEEMTAFRSWQSKQETEAEKLKKERNDISAELEKAKATIEQHSREKFLTGKGVSADDLDYYVYKIAQKVTDEKSFEAAAEEYLKEHKPAGKARVDMSGSLNGKSGEMTSDEQMNALIRGKFK